MKSIMKNIKVILLTIGFQGFLMAGAAYAADASNLMIFGGELTENPPCAIVPGDEDQTVSLGIAGDNDFYDNGGESRRIDFQIHLATCDTALTNQVTLKFTGTAATALNLSDYLANTGNATGVAIGIAKDDDTLLPLNDATGADYPILTPENTLNLKAFIKASDDDVTNQTITPGTVGGIASFTLDYT